MLRTTALSAETLATVLSQSADCVKLIALDGSVQWFNPNGLCAMEIDDLSMVRGRQWADLWPDDSRPQVVAGLQQARMGEPAKFDAFCPTAKGKPRWWSVSIAPVTDADGRDAGFLAISRDITEVELTRQALEVTTAELRHRLRNTYAMIGSLLLGFARGTPAYEDFAREMQSRLVSLSAAQALFSTSDAPCDLAELVTALVSPFETPGCTIDLADIPRTEISQAQADAIALVLGELAVNSAKYGALAAAGGAITIATRCEDGMLALTWTEVSTATVPAARNEAGQGHRLIDQIVRMRGGSLAIDWTDRGLTMVLRLPQG